MVRTEGVFAGVLALYALERLAELVVSRRRRPALPPPLPEPGVFPLMVAVHTGLVVLPLLEVLLLGRPFVPALAALVAAALALGMGLRLASMAALGHAWTIDVVVPGRVVNTGAYAWLRHPNYVGVVLEVACLPLLHGAWASALLLSGLNAVVLARRVRVEDAALRRAAAT